MLSPRRLVTICALLASGTVLSSCGAQQASTTRDRIVGSWELQSRSVQRSGGEVINDPVLGERPIGRLFYSSSGHVALQMMRLGRAQAITEPAAGADARNARVVLGYDAAGIWWADFFSRRGFAGVEPL